MNMTHKKYLALVIAGVLTSTVQAESFRDAMQGGKFSGDVNNVMALGSYTDNIPAAGLDNNSKVGSTALSLAYKTSSYKGLSFGVNFQHGKDWDLQDGAMGFGSEDDPRISVNSTNLQNLYVNYSFDPSITKTSLRLGRQDIISPLIMRSGMFPMKDAFDALVITNKDLSNTTLKLMYVDKWIKRHGYDASPSFVEQDTHFDGDVYSLYLNNKSIKGLNIEGQWMSNNSKHTDVGDGPTNVRTSGPYDTTFLRLSYKVPNINLTLGATNATASFDNSANTDSWGFIAGTKLADIGVDVAFTTVDGANSLPGTLGHVPWFRGYAKTITSAEFKAGVDTTSITFKYNFGIEGLKSSLVYASWAQSDEGIVNSKTDLDGASELALNLQYKFKSIAGLSARIQFSQMDYNVDVGDSDMTYTRMHLKYQF